VTHNAVHSPLQGADAYMKKFAHINDVQRRIFAAMLANLDDSVGTVLQKIHSEGLEQDTLVIFLSDNGGPTRELSSSNLPLRGEKGQMYEGGIRVPFMMSWPGRLPAGTVYHEPVSSVDLSATALAIAGVKPDPKSDGINLIPYLSGTNRGRPHDNLFWRQGFKTAIRMGDWKLLRHGRKDVPGPWELYDLSEDLSETKNLVTAEPKKFQELLSVWKKLDAEMIEPAFP
jgi:arylsulfatase A-like enzyme